MIRSLQSLASDLHYRSLEFRNFERLIKQETFKKVYDTADAEQKLDFQEIAAEGSYSCAIEWYQTRLQESKLLEEYPMADLRLICAELSVKNWRNMTKQMLVAAIRHCNGVGNGKL